MEIYVDADACPVKPEILRVAARHNLIVHMVSNSWMRLDESPFIKRVVVGDAADAADDWIAERVTPSDIVVTADILLAARALKAGAQCIGPAGKPFSDANIGMALAMRDMQRHLRETGESRGHNPAFTARDRLSFFRRSNTQCKWDYGGGHHRRRHPRASEHRERRPGFNKHSVIPAFAGIQETFRMWKAIGVANLRRQDDEGKFDRAWPRRERVSRGAIGKNAYSTGVTA